MALFAFQLLRVVWAFISVPLELEPYFESAGDIVNAIDQMLNVISVHFYFFSSAKNIYLTRALHPQ